MGRPKTAGKSTSKREAIKMAQDEEHKLRFGTWVDPNAGRVTFSEYFEEQWVPDKTGEINTIAKYQMHYDALTTGSQPSTTHRSVRSGSPETDGSRPPRDIRRAIRARDSTRRAGAPKRRGGSLPVSRAVQFKLIASAQARWREVNAPHPVTLVRAGATFEKDVRVERPDEQAGVDQQVT